MSVVQKLEQYKKQLVASRKVVDEDAHIKEIIDTYLSESESGKFNFREISRIFDILAVQTESLLQDKELLKLSDTNEYLVDFSYVLDDVFRTLHYYWLDNNRDAFVGIKELRGYLRDAATQLDRTIKSLS